MKRILFFALIALSQLNLPAQTIDLTENVELNLPKNFVRASASTLRSSKLFKTKTSILQNPNFKGEIYTVDNAIITLNGGSGAVQPDFLERFEKEWTQVIKKGDPTLLKSEIRNLSGFKALIIQTEHASTGTGNYIIRCVNDQYNKVLIGLVDYQLSNRQATAKLVETILKSLHFK